MVINVLLQILYFFMAQLSKSQFWDWDYCFREGETSENKSHLDFLFLKYSLETQSRAEAFIVRARLL